MDAIRIRKQLTSHTLDVPELAPFIGRVVEILVVEGAGNVEDEPHRAVRFVIDDSFDLGPIGEAVMRSGALSRLA